MKLKPYPEYKDSGVEWIGEIPRRWELRRLKYNSSVNPPGKKSLSDPNAKVNFLPMEKVSEDGDYDLESETEYENVSSGYTYFEDNDVLLAKITPCFENGKGALVENLRYGFGFGTTEFHILRFGDNTYPNFLYFLTKSHLFRVTGEAFMEGAAGQKRVSTDFVKNFPMPTPLLIEQKQIVSYLNKKTSEIDLTIEKDTQLIELLKEKRTALINHVVTKGLDPTVNMKDSGVEWIGEIPEIWEARKIKTFSVVRRGASPRPIDDPKYFDEEGEYSWVRIADVTASSKYLYNTTEKLSILGKSFSVPLEPDELFISIAGSVGKPIIAKIKCCIHDGFVYFQDLKLDPEYLYYIFIGGQAFQGLGKLGTQLNLNTETIGNIKIPHPSKEEQKEITQFLDGKTSKINETIEKIQNKINLLEEYKKSLIHHVVTGKVDVREVAL